MDDTSGVPPCSWCGGKGADLAAQYGSCRLAHCTACAHEYQYVPGEELPAAAEHDGRYGFCEHHVPAYICRTCAAQQTGVTLVVTGQGCITCGESPKDRATFAEALDQAAARRLTDAATVRVLRTYLGDHKARRFIAWAMGQLTTGDEHSPCGCPACDEARRIIAVLGYA